MQTEPISKITNKKKDKALHNSEKNNGNEAYGLTLYLLSLPSSLLWAKDNIWSLEACRKAALTIDLIWLWLR